MVASVQAKVNEAPHSFPFVASSVVLSRPCKVHAGSPARGAQPATPSRSIPQKVPPREMALHAAHWPQAKSLSTLQLPREEDAQDLAGSLPPVLVCRHGWRPNRRNQQFTHRAASVHRCGPGCGWRHFAARAGNGERQQHRQTKQHPRR